MKLPNKEAARPTTQQSTPLKTDTPTVSAQAQPVNTQEAVALLRQIAEKLDQIDASLANIGGTLDSIQSRMP